MEYIIIVLQLVAIMLLIKIRKEQRKMGESLEELKSKMAEIDTETTRIATFIAEQFALATSEKITLAELETAIQPSLDALKLVGQPTP